MTTRYVFGCDIGGTFTDFVLYDRETGGLYLEKCLTTPDDPSKGVLHGVNALNERVDGFLTQTAQMLHGTTLVINAVIERKGATTGLVTTAGFRDILEIGTERRYDVYDLQQEYPRPLVPRYLRAGITERVRGDGTVLTSLDISQLDSIVDLFSRNAVESVAVCLLHSYRNPEHENEVAKRLSELLPEVPVSISSDVLPEINEYARVSTTVVNAYTQPLMKRYLSGLERNLSDHGFNGRILVMLSSGGVTAADTAVRFPVRVIESGPVGGVIMGQHVRKLIDLGPAIAFDMGGTTAKVCLLEGEEPRRASQYEVARVHRFKRGSGIPIKVPCVDLLEIGTGGGSIAGIGPLGLLEVGPQSAGAEPGPACYGRGGIRPTTTDADLVLGYLDPDNFLGGTMQLDLEASKAAINREIAAPLELEVTAAAWGIHDLANESMAAAARVYAAERGVNAASMALIASGGAGPLHAYGLAAKLGIMRIVVPPAVGVASAVGFLSAPVSYDLVQTCKTPLGQADLNDLEELFGNMQARLTETLSAAGSYAASFDRSLDIRYVGQGYEIPVHLPDKTLPELGKEDLFKRFQASYEQLFGGALKSNEFEIVNIRLTGRGPETESPLTLRAGNPVGGEPWKGSRPAYCGTASAFVEHNVYDRYVLAPGFTIEGPAIIEERESTTIVGNGARVQIDEIGALHINLA